MAAPRPLTFSVNLASPFDQWGGPARLGEAARLAEKLGYAAVEMGEHLAIPADFIGFSGQEWYDNFVLISHLATLTTRLRFHFNALVAPYHPPIQTAKMIATLDHISGGRVSIAIGAGHVESEFAALGVPYKSRAAMTDDYIKAMQVLWTQPKPTYHGRFVSFTNLNFEPKCLQKPHVPVLIGGTGPRAKRRAATLGDGWAPNQGSLEEVAAGVQEIKKMAKEVGRDPERLRFAYRLPIGDRNPWAEKPHSPGHAPLKLSTEPPKTPEEITTVLRLYQAAGFEHMRIMYSSRNADDFLQKMTWFAEKVIPVFKG